jgi:hypothetical protein
VSVSIAISFLQFAIKLWSLVTLVFGTREGLAA